MGRMQGNTRGERKECSSEKVIKRRGRSCMIKYHSMYPALKTACVSKLYLAVVMTTARYGSMNDTEVVWHVTVGDLAHRSSATG